MKSFPSATLSAKAEPGIVVRNGAASPDQKAEPEPESDPEPSVMRWGFHREFNPSINNARDHT